MQFDTTVRDPNRMVPSIREFCEHRCGENRTFVLSVIGITFMRLPW